MRHSWLVLIIDVKINVVSGQIWKLLIRCGHGEAFPSLFICLCIVLWWKNDYEVRVDLSNSREIPILSWGKALNKLVFKKKFLELRSTSLPRFIRVVNRILNSPPGFGERRQCAFPQNRQVLVWSALWRVCFDQEHPGSLWLLFEVAAFPLRAELYRQPYNVHNDWISRIRNAE